MTNLLFGDCLKLLLACLDISNSRLSKAINVDSSLVNRWIHGHRVPPYNSSYVDNISDYLSKNVHNTIQEHEINSIYIKLVKEEYLVVSTKEKINRILLEAQGHSVEFKKKKQKEIKKKSLIKDQVAKVQLSHSLSKEKSNISPFTALSSQDKVVYGTESIITSYYDLLELAANEKSKKNSNIYITYNNSIDPEYLSLFNNKRWIETLHRVINNGWNVHVLIRLNSSTIRTVRFLNCIVSLIQTGKFFPYYIKNYDSLTIGEELIVVPDIGVLSCLSANIYSYINSGLYLMNKAAIRIYQEHLQIFFRKYALPLVNIFTNRSDFGYYLAKVEDDIGNRFLYKYCFSVITLPTHLYEKLLEQKKYSDDSKSLSLEFYHKRLQAFLSNIDNYEYFDIYMASSIKNLIKKHQFYLYSYAGIESISMDTEDIIEYLVNIIKLLQEHRNYNIAFLPDDQDTTDNIESFCCLVKDRSTILIESSNEYTITQETHISITEPTLVKDIFDYCKGLWEHISPTYKEKPKVISWLQDQISILKQLI